MGYGLTQISAPSSEPVTLADAKRQARVDIDTDNGLITDLIAEARVWCEEYTSRCFVSRLMRMTLDRFPCWLMWSGSLSGVGWDGIIRLPRSPVLSVDAVKYIDSAGDEQTLSSGLYQLDASREPARLAPAYGHVWPVTRLQMGAVKVEFTAGYGTASDVPKGLQRAVKMLAAHWYDARGIVELSGAIPKEIPFTLESMLAPFVVGDAL